MNDLISVINTYILVQSKQPIIKKVDEQQKPLRVLLKQEPTQYDNRKDYY